MNRLSVYSVIALALLIAYYFGLTQVQISEEWLSTFFSLILLGYFTLGVVFGFLFRREVLTTFALVFALGFLGSTVSIVLYRGLSDPNVFVASFFIGTITAAGTLVHALLVKVWRWRSKSPRKKQDII